MNTYEKPMLTVICTVASDILTVSLGDWNDPLYEQEFGEAED